MTESSDPNSANSLPGNTQTNLDAEWEEAEQELSRGALPQSSQPEPRQPTRSPQSVLPNVHATVRSLEPSSPLVMVETAFLASAASLIWLVNSYFPLGPVFRVFFPIPIALIYLRWGHRAAWMGALVSGLLLSVLMGPPRSLQYVMPFGLMGVLLGQLWRRKAGWGMSIVLSGILATFGFFFRIWLTSILLGDDLWLYSTSQVTTVISNLCSWLGILYQPTLVVVQAFAIAMVALSNLIYAFVVHLVAWFLFDRLGNPIPRPPKWVQVLMEYEE
jgi:uncharacterized protein YybS (DUF2232 family)